MHAAPRHGTPSLMSLPKDGGVSCFLVVHLEGLPSSSDRTMPCLTSVKLMELALQYILHSGGTFLECIC